MDKNKLQVMWQIVDGYQSVQWAAAKLKKSERTIKRYAARLRLNPNGYTIELALDGELS